MRPAHIHLTTAHRTVVSTLAALVLAAALPQAGLAMTTSESGLWKVTRSDVGSISSTLVIERVRQGEKATNGNTFIVISKGKAYLARAAGDASSGGVRAVDYSTWSGMKLVHIGSHVRATDDCGSRCQSGLPSDRMTVTFRNAGGGRQAINEMLAEQD